MTWSRIGKIVSTSLYLISLAFVSFALVTLLIVNYSQWSSQAAHSSTAASNPAPVVANSKGKSIAGSDTLDAVVKASAKATQQGIDELARPRRDRAHAPYLRGSNLVEPGYLRGGETLTTFRDVVVCDLPSQAEEAFTLLLANQSQEFITKSTGCDILPAGNDGVVIQAINGTLFKLALKAPFDGVTVWAREMLFGDWGQFTRH